MFSSSGARLRLRLFLTKGPFHSAFSFHFLVLRSRLPNQFSKETLLRKTLALFAVILTLGMTTVAFDAEAARRLGGGKSAGMQKQNVAPPANAPANSSAAPNQAAPAAGTAAAAAPAAAAAATKRSWMGPLAGLAAGLGLAALASHLGMGEAFANMLMIGLLVMGVLLVVGMVMRKRAAAQAGALAGAGGVGSVGGPFGQPQPHSQQGTLLSSTQPQGGSLIGSRIGGGLGDGTAASPNVGSIPADFDAVGFARNAQDQFMALQAANDAGDLDRLSGYLTPEMFESAKADLAARGNSPQQTQVFGLTAQVVNVAEEGAQYVVSVRFMGSVRDEAGAVPEDLDEVWHLTKPKVGMGGWVIAGIQQGK
jgi:predicted lipid-binding transport protein (Tim44 family)